MKVADPVLLLLDLFDDSEVEYSEMLSGYDSYYFISIAVIVMCAEI